MIKSKTVFVVGAGASKELHLPVGDELKRQLAEKLDIKFEYGNQLVGGDRFIAEALRVLVNYGNEYNEYLHCGRNLCAAMPQAISIDNYIDAHSDNGRVKLLGKLGIARAILSAEKSSRLYADPRSGGSLYDPAMIEKTWLLPFVQLLTEDVPKSRLENIFSNITFIVFNYDRCIEHLLSHALALYYSIPLTDAQSLVSHLNIVHPYGVVGKLPWQKGPGHPIEFGNDQHNGETLLAIADDLKTFSERVEEGGVLNAIRNSLAVAETIVFLGFAFYEQNMRLLSTASKMRRAYATAYGFSKRDAEVIRNQIHRVFERDETQLRVDVDNELRCAGLFHEFQKSLRQ